MLKEYSRREYLIFLGAKVLDRYGRVRGGHAYTVLRAMDIMVDGR